MNGLRVRVIFLFLLQIVLLGGSQVVWAQPEVIQPPLDEETEVPRLIQALKQGDAGMRIRAAQLLARSAHDPRVVQPLLDAVDDQNPLVQVQVVTALGATGDARAVDPLIRETRDPYAPVAVAAVAALGKIDDPRAREALLTIAETPRDAQRGAAIQALGAQLFEWREPTKAQLVRLRKAFASALTEKDGALRTAAVQALGKMNFHLAGDTEISNLLAGLAKDPVAAVRKAVVLALWQWKDPRAVEVALAGLKDPAQEVANEAMMRLQIMTDDGGALQTRLLAAMRDLLKDPDGRVRRAAVRMIEGHAGPTDAALIRPLLKDPDAGVRAETARILYLLNDAASADALLAATKDTDPEVRRFAVEALGKLGDARISVTLLPMIKDPDGNVRGAALRVLGQLKDPKTIDVLIAGLKDPQREARWGAAQALGQFDDPKVTEALIEAIKDPDPGMRGNMAAALGHIKNNPRVVDALIPLLNDGGWLAAQAAYALGSIGDPRAAQPLVLTLARCVPAMGREGVGRQDFGDHEKIWALRSAIQHYGSVVTEKMVAMLADPDPVVSAAAVAALRWYPDARAVPGLLPLLKDKRPEVRWQAVSILGQLADARAIEPLQATMKDTDPSVRGEVVRALWQIGGPQAETVMSVSLTDPLADIRFSTLKVFTEYDSVGRRLSLRANSRLVPTVIALLRDPDPRIPPTAANALSESGDIRALRPLLGYIRTLPGGGNARVGSFRECKDPKAIEILLAAAKETNAKVKQYALGSLRFSITDPRVQAILKANAQGQSGMSEMMAIDAQAKKAGKDAALVWIKVLQNPNPNIRSSACYQLSRLHDLRAYAPLQAMLGDKENRVRGSAVAALGQLGDSRAADHIFPLLKNASLSSNAIAALAQLHDKRLLGYLLVDLKDPRRVNPFYLRALGTLKDPRAVEPLLKLLQGMDMYTDGFVYHEVADALAAIGDPRAVEPLLAVLQKDSIYFQGRGSVIPALGKLKDARAVEPLIAALQNPPSVRDGFSYGLVSGAPREQIANALAEIGDPRAVEPLCAALGWGLMEERSAAAFALGKLNDRRAVKPLIDELPNLTGAARTAAAQALKAITGQDFGEDAGKWRGWWEAQADRTGLEKEQEKEQEKG